MRTPRLARTAAACLLLGLAGCASPRAGMLALTFPEIPDGEGRVFFYRLSSMGRPPRPDIRLNGKVIGEAQAGTYFYRDLPPGRYVVMTKAKTAHEATFALADGDTRFIRIDVTDGIGHPKPVVATQKEASRQLLRLEAWEPESQGTLVKVPAASVPKR